MQTEWPHLLADLKRKRAALDQVIAVIETNFVVVDSVEDTPRRSPAKAPRRPLQIRRSARAPKRIKSVDKRTDGRTEHEPRQRAVRSLPDDADHTAQIVAAVRNAGGVIKRADLRTALGTSLYHTIHWLRAAIKTRAVVTTGSKASYRISLPGTKPAKEGP